MRQVMAEVAARPSIAAHPRPRDIVGELMGRRCTLLETAGFEVTGIELYDVPHVHASADAAVRCCPAWRRKCLPGNSREKAASRNATGGEVTA